ncbi:hypothetical protein KXR94_04425 [Stutzerimonas stutzeri]
MSAKRVGIGTRPMADAQARAWIRQASGQITAKGSVYTARLTLDITPEMRARIKVAAFREGVTVAQMLRELLEAKFPERKE